MQVNFKFGMAPYFICTKLSGRMSRSICHIVNYYCHIVAIIIGFTDSDIILCLQHPFVWWFVMWGYDIAKNSKLVPVGFPQTPPQQESHVILRLALVDNPVVIGECICHQEELCNKPASPGLNRKAPPSSLRNPKLTINQGRFIYAVQNNAENWR
jgi:hypothetical protein